MAEIARERLWAAARNFQYEGKVTEIYPYGNGHINDTFLKSYDSSHCNNTAAG